MAHVIIGTSGHVDHGKTSLIKALTGVDTDRLKEEKERGITIQLGFTYFHLPDGSKAGIVDVPGHEKFVRNMLAGVGGMDIVLLVVAADEGVMPQTKEHLNILKLLDVKKGIVVITKKDLVDEELLELVKEDIKDHVKGSFLEGAPFVPVSSVTGEGIEELKEEIIRLTSNVEEGEVKDFFRLPVDRVFTLKGFGTVVTGTLKDGVVSVGDSCILYPSGKEVKVRSIQVHGEKVEKAYPGQRTAINITGVEKEEVSMGDLLTTFGYLTPQNKVNCVLNLLEDAPTLKNGEMVRFHWGTEETYGRAVLLDREELAPGEKSYCQIRLNSPVVVARNDHFVIRSMSPVDTIGGGVVLESTLKRVPRYNKNVLQKFEILDKGSIEEKILLGLKEHSAKGVAKEELGVLLQIDIREIEGVLDKLLEKDRVLILAEDGKEILVESSIYNFITKEIEELLKEYHQRFPLREGVNKEELRSKLGELYSVKLLNSILKRMEKEGIIHTSGLYIGHRDFKITLSEKEEKKIVDVLKQIGELAFKPPTKEEVGLDNKLLEYLVAQGKVIPIENFLFHPEVFHQGVRKVVELIKDNPKGVNIGQIKEVLDTTRKYLVPFLEYLDGEGITRRIGEVRILGSKGREMV
jgi:selenocysteine-specific elongation factor